MRKLKQFLSIATLMFSFSTLTNAANTVQFSAAGGFNWVKSNNNNLYVSPFETDSNRIIGISNQPSWKVGAGYSLFQDLLSQRNWLSALLLELNFYHSAATIKGDVWQYQLPQFNNYSFRAPFISNRLMIDVKPTLFTFHTVSPYLIMGAGVTWNTMSYNQSVTGVDVNPASYISLGKHTHTQVAYDLGFGVNKTITNHLSASVEYLYTSLGKASPASNPNNSITIDHSPTFTLRNQAVLFGLNWKL